MIPETGGLKKSRSNAELPNKIQINTETGVIKLPNGKSYKVKVKTSEGIQVLGKDQQELTKLIIDLLNRSQEEKSFSFKDLSKTKITHEGISTDQGKKAHKPLSERVITPLNFDQSFKEITELATGILSKSALAGSPGSLKPEAEFTGPLADDEEETSSEREPPSGTHPLGEQRKPASHSSQRVSSDTGAPSLEEEFADYTYPSGDRRERSSVSDAGECDFRFEEEEEVVRSREERGGRRQSSAFEVSFSEVNPEDTSAPKYKPMQESEEKTIGKQAQAALSYVGGKISGAWTAMISRIKNLFEEKKEAFAEETVEGIPPNSMPDLREGELHLVFEEVPESELTKTKFSPAFSWQNITLEEINHALSMAVTSNRKLRVVDGKLDVKKRETHILKSNVGTSEKSQEIVKSIIDRLHKELILCNANLSTPDISRQQVLMVSEKMNTIQEAIKNLKESHWAKEVLKKNETLDNLMTLFEQDHKKAVENLETLEASDAWKFLGPDQCDATLHSIKEEKFRLDYLRNYRLYNTSESMLAEKHQKFIDYGKLLDIASSLEPDSEGNIIIETSEGNVSCNRAEMIQTMKELQKGVVRFCIEWLQDPFINNGEYQEENIQDILSQIVEAVEGTQHIQQAEKDALFNMVDAIGQEEPRSLVPAKTIGSPDYVSYADRLIDLSLGISTKDRDQLLEEMADDIFTLNAYHFSQLTSREFTGQAWTKKNKDQTSPNLTALVDLSNNITDLVKFSVVGMTTVDGSVEDPMQEKRARMIEFYIDLASKALERNDFQLLMNIKASLDNPSIGRLKKTWEQVSEGHKEKHREISELLAPENNFSSLRTKMSELKAKEGAVYIPYTGKLCADYTFVEEGNTLLNYDGEAPRIIASTLELYGNTMDDIAVPRERIINLQDENPNMLRLHRDLSQEMQRFHDSVPDLLVNIAFKRGKDNFSRFAEMNPKMEKLKKDKKEIIGNTEFLSSEEKKMLDDLNKKALEDMLYAESLAIEPRKK